ncbi:glycosyltransferase, partial [Anaerosolibacter sp.]|uniref:glycosyltransferase n=1 Tax=Anaerosolibacter sp. TaxID=1872527 RepID=UPI0039EEC89E
MPKLSIVVPIFNVEDYLPACIDSILNQTYTDFELILVNDGSIDKCEEICVEYKKKDARIKVIHKKNGGVSSARNVGIQIAEGEYLAFVDPDDTIENNMYEELIST